MNEFPYSANLRSGPNSDALEIGEYTINGFDVGSNFHCFSENLKRVVYLRMARAAEVIDPSFIVVENVTAVQWDTNEIVSETRKALEKLGYRVGGDVVDMSTLGVPQKRRRHLLIASRIESVIPSEIFAELRAHGPVDSDLRWAIGDLENVEQGTLMHLPSVMSATNQKRTAYLFAEGEYELPDRLRPPCHQNGGHSYKSVYGRLGWDQPAQTITTGFGSMGQGRYVHPSQQRTITPHEAARIQTFPDWFDFGEATKRTRLATMIGNAVPPLLMVRIGDALFSRLA